MKKLCLTLFALAMGVSPLSASEQESAAYVETYQAALDDPLGAGASALAARLPAVTLPLAPARQLYVIEGDVTATSQQLANYLIQQKKDAHDDTLHPEELIVHEENGVPAHWATGAQQLKYAVVRATFPSDAAYQQVVEEMELAGNDWEAACASCSVTFDHAPAHDGITTWNEYLALASVDDIRFAVVYSDDANGPIASAFFPTEPIDRRLLAVFPAYFNLSGSVTGQGVLRHELGHVLGYRHEHTRHVAGCTFEDDHWIELTEYDAYSVMHYFCGGGGSPTLSISDKDEEGQAKHYGMVSTP